MAKKYLILFYSHDKKKQISDTIFFQLTAINVIVGNGMKKANRNSMYFIHEPPVRLSDMSKLR